MEYGQKASKNNIIKVMFIYWISVIIWQTIRPVANRSLIDSVVKISLFFPVLFYGWKNQNLKRFDTIAPYFLVFLLTQMTTLIFDSGEVGISSLITIIFMMMQIVIFLIFLPEEKASVSMLETLCKGLVVVGVVMSLYNVIFNWGRFRLVFSVSVNAYGNECKSFLYSNHEFGIYLSAALLSLLWFYFKKRIKEIFVLLIGVLLIVNLLSTYSRTAILGLIAASLILVFFYSKKTFAIVLSVIAVLLIVALSNDFVNDLVFGKIMKGSFVEGEVLDEERGNMYAQEWAAFRSGSLMQILFGQGYVGAAKYGGHDAYLIILLTGGVVMFGFFAFMICFGIYQSFKVLKQDRGTGALLFGYQVFALLYMVAQTPILFYSSMDSFFITMIAILVPFYISNGIHDKNEEKDGDESRSN